MSDWFSTDDRRRQLLAALNRWMGTPFMPHQRVPGAGVDCIQLAAAVYLEAGPITEFESGPYTLDRGMHFADSLIRSWLDRSPHFRYVDDDGWAIGDLLTFRIGRSEHHCGIVFSSTHFIHAIREYGVIVSAIRDATWSKRLTAVYRPISP